MKTNSNLNLSDTISNKDIFSHEAIMSKSPRINGQRAVSAN
jgi:hypothetical protein